MHAQYSSQVCNVDRPFRLDVTIYGRQRRKNCTKGYTPLPSGLRFSGVSPVNPSRRNESSCFPGRKASVSPLLVRQSCDTTTTSTWIISAAAASSPFQLNPVPDDCHADHNRHTVFLIYTWPTERAHCHSPVGPLTPPTTSIPV